MPFWYVEETSISKRRTDECCTFWFSKSTAVRSRLFHWINTLWPFSPVWSLSPEPEIWLRGNGFPPKLVSFRCEVPKSALRRRKRRRRIKYRCPRRTLHVWHLYGIFLFSLLLRVQLPKFFPKNEMIIGLSLSTTTKAKSPKYSRPSQEDIDSINSPLAATMLESLPATKSKKLRDIFPTASDDALDLLRNLL